MMTIERQRAIPSMARILRALCIAFSFTIVLGFVPLQTRQRIHLTNQLKKHESSSNVDDCRWLKCGLLISSWTDGVVQSPEAQAFLKKSLATLLLSELQHDAEAAVQSSVTFSPCNGPNMDAFTNMESVDKILTRIQRDPDHIDKWIEQMDEDTLNLRFLYIPTAMYALKSDSINSPGKQRQRARADGKKRRTLVIQTIHQLFLQKINILAVTLDLDDGSIKQPEGSKNANFFPKDGKEALREWAPHFVYVEGGNTFWLHHCMVKGGWEEDLLSAISGAVYCGKSAGAILAGRTVETATWKVCIISLGFIAESLFVRKRNYNIVALAC